MDEIEGDYFNSCMNEHYNGLPIEKKHSYIKTILGHDIVRVLFTKKCIALSRMNLFRGISSIILTMKVRLEAGRANRPFRPLI